MCSLYYTERTFGMPIMCYGLQEYLYCHRNNQKEVEYSCAISLLLGIICHICSDAWRFIMQCSNSLCFFPMAEKISFELHSLRDRIGENRSNYFCCPYFCAGSSSGESFVRPNGLESLEIQWWTLTQLL